MSAESLRAPSGYVSVTTKLFYGFGSVAYGVKDNGFGYLLLIFYNQVVGLPAPAVGLAIMLALIVDAFIDPIVGQVSDNWRSRWGRRHPFMYAAAGPVAISYVLLWTPPAGNPTAAFIYLMVVAIVIRTFITLYEIPSTALAAELSTNYDERTSILSYRYFFGWWGGLAMSLAALKIFLRPTAEQPIGQLNAEGYLNYGIVAAMVMFAAILISAAGTHRHIPSFRVAEPRKWSAAQLGREMASTLSHRSFLMLMLASLFNAMGQGVVMSLNLYFNTYFWELSAGQIAFFTLSNFASAALAFAFARPLSERMGKKAAAQLTKILAFAIGLAPIALRLLGAFPENGDPAVFWILLVQTLISTGLGIVAAILFSSMIADVVEDSQLRTGRRSEGLFFSAAAFVAKAVSGVGVFASSIILVAANFPSNAQPGAVPDSVMRDFGLIYVAVLMGVAAASFFFVSLYSITRSSHEASLRALAEAGAVLPGVSAGPPDPVLAVSTERTRMPPPA